MSRRSFVIFILAVASCLAQDTQLGVEHAECVYFGAQHQKGKDKWEIARGPDVKVTGELKVGSKVTIEYTMKASTIDVSGGAKPKAEKK